MLRSSIRINVCSCATTEDNVNHSVKSFEKVLNEIKAEKIRYKTVKTI